MDGSAWRAGVAGLALAVLGSCAHGGNGVKLSAGDGTASTVTSTTGPSDPTTSTAEPSSTSIEQPSTSTSRSFRSTTTTAGARAPASCTKASPTTTTTTGGTGGSYDTTSVTGLFPPGGSAAGPSSPPCPLKVAAGSWGSFDPGPLASRTEAVAVWTGREMVVVGGLVGYAAGTDGAAYDPTTGRWHMIATRPDPDRVVRLGAWTGKELVVFGVPRDNLSGPPTTAAAYDPAADRWRSTAPPPAELSTGQLVPMMAGWTGSQVVLYEVGWGVPGKANVARAGLYDPATDRWTVLPPIEDATAVGRAGVAGDRLAVLGLSKGAGGPEPRLFLFDAARGVWHTSPAAPVAIPSYPQVPPVWSGRELIVTPNASYPSGPSVAYDPATDRWRALDAPSVADVAFGSRGPRLGDGRVIAQVDNPSGPLGFYDAGPDAWTGSGAIPGTPPSGAVLVSTGHEVLFWGMRYEGGYVRPEQPSAAWIWTPAG
ncbi:MAG: hypothetical protein QOE80_4171 [Actinomycetota bacterium]|nr:hypothetical protein [Actinomycetota bacterium]